MQSAVSSFNMLLNKFVVRQIHRHCCRHLKPADDPAANHKQRRSRSFSRPPPPPNFQLPARQIILTSCLWRKSKNQCKRKKRRLSNPELSAALTPNDPEERAVGLTLARSDDVAKGRKSQTSTQSLHTSGLSETAMLAFYHVGNPSPSPPKTRDWFSLVIFIATKLIV